MSLYKTYKTDQVLEKKGIEFEIDEGVVFTIARAGGSNAEFKKVFQDRIKPYKQQMKRNNLPPSLEQEILAGVYAETVVLGWKSKVESEDGQTWHFEDWIEGEDGDKIPFSAEACKKLFMDLPEVFLDVQEVASEAAAFRNDEVAADLKPLKSTSDGSSSGESD